MSVPKLGTIASESQGIYRRESAAGDLGHTRFGPVGLELLEEARALGPYPDLFSRLSDADIREALRYRRDVFRIVESDLVLEEVECWRGYSRADFLCVSGGSISVIEIKSDRDSLRRFDEQARVYSAVADRVTLVVGWCLAAQVLRAAPWWWDVVLAERAHAAQVQFIPLRDGAPNPGVTVSALLSMLPTSELSHLARLRGLPTRLRQYELRQLIASQISRCEVRAAITTWFTKLAKQRAMSS